MAWQQTFQLHLIRLEKLAHKDSTPVRSESRVYLAGIIAREQDTEYQTEIVPFLFEDGEMGDLIRRHSPYIGQNAPVWFATKINAEHNLYRDAVDGVRDHLHETAQQFGLASHFVRQAGNKTLAGIFEEFQSRVGEVNRLIRQYLSVMDWIDHEAVSTAHFSESDNVRIDDAIRLLRNFV